MRRARSTRGIWLAAFLATAAVSVAPASAQVPDTTATDTVRVAIPPSQAEGDTIPTAVSEAAESATSVAAMPDFPATRPMGWHAGRWRWTSDELARLPGITLLDFLERIPGVIRFRAGGFGRPTGITALGAGGARVRVFLDGFELDPLDAGSFPFETLSLLDVSGLRVERSLSGIRVDVETFRLTDPEAYSKVELGTGASQTRLLRAIFSRGLQDRSVLTGAFDIVSTAGIGIREDYSQTNAVFRWSYGLGEDTGVQLDWRRTAMDRAGSVYPQQLTRSDLAVRGRRRVSDRLTVEALLSRSSAEDEADPLVPDLLRTHQAAARAAFSMERLGVEAAARVRTAGDPASPVPTAEAELRGLFDPSPSLRLEAESRVAAGDGQSGAEARVIATTSPLPWMSIFGSVTLGRRLVPFLRLEERPLDGETGHRLVGALEPANVAGWRAGGDFAGRAGNAGFALFLTDTRTAPFGLPFDRGSPLADPLPGVGAEGYVAFSLPRTGDALSVEAWYTRFADVEDRVYTPLAVGRAALVFHDVYYQGELEPLMRLEAVHRGSARVFTSAGSAAATSTAPGQTLNFLLSVRIIDVRAFLLWENLLNTQTAVDLPGVPPALPRIVYGASWRFTN